MSGSWVKFHETITTGSKLGMPRAHRFIYLELSLKARSLAGEVELPRGMGDVEGTCCLLSGDPKEVRSAIKTLTDPTDPLIEFFGEVGRRRIRIVSWSRWNDAPGGSTERVKRHRDRNKSPDSDDMKRVTDPLQTRFETPVERVGNANETPVKRSREEKRREDPPIVPQEGTLFLVPIQDKPASPAEQVFAAYLEGWRRHIGRGAPPTLDENRKRLVATRLKHHPLDQLIDAVTGLWLSDWNIENRATDFGLAIRDAAHVEKFAALAAQPRHGPVDPAEEPESWLAEKAMAKAQIAAGETK